MTMRQVICVNIFPNHYHLLYKQTVFFLHYFCVNNCIFRKNEQAKVGRRKKSALNDNVKTTHWPPRDEHAAAAAAAAVTTVAKYTSVWMM